MKDEAQRVQSVVVAHALLQALGEAAEAMSLASLARALDMTPPRVLRHLGTLVELGLVERSGPEPLYRLGVGLIRLGQQASVQHELTRFAYGALQSLSDVTGQAVFLGRPQDGRVVIWLSFQSLSVPHLTMPPGMTFSLDGSACGRVLLAFGAASAAQPQFGVAPSNSHPDPLAGPPDLEERLALIKARLYDLYGAQQANAVYSLAAPVLDHTDTAVAAIGLVGFSAQFREQRNAALSALMATARSLSEGLGSRLPWPSKPVAIA